MVGGGGGWWWWWLVVVVVVVVGGGGGRGLASFPGPRFIQLHEGKKRAPGYEASQA